MKAISGQLTKFMRDDEAKFRLATSLKFALIPVGSIIVLTSLIWIILSLNLLFIEAYGTKGSALLREAFFDSILLALTDFLPWLVIFFSALLFGGLYMANMVLRPFQVIGRYCESRIEGEVSHYNPDFFEDLRLLSRFSDFFFLKLDLIKKGECSYPVEIPPLFTRIHGPVFEYNFFVQFLLFTLMSTICATVAVHVVAVDIYDGIVNLAKEMLNHDNAVKYFLGNQGQVWNVVILLTVLFHTTLYFVFLSQLYQKVSTPAFGFFATMRSFLKGNTGSRVHLIGYSYIRGQSRKFNKYLDLAEAEFKSNAKKS